MKSCNNDRLFSETILDRPSKGYLPVLQSQFDTDRFFGRAICISTSSKAPQASSSHSVLAFFSSSEFVSIKGWLSCSDVSSFGNKVSKYFKMVKSGSWNSAVALPEYYKIVKYALKYIGL